MYELETRFDSRKSFYGKAQVKVVDDNYSHFEMLYSYGTLVGTYKYYRCSGVEEFSVNGKFSQTTTRHQKEFFKQKGLTDNLIKELFKKGFLEIREV